jgi:hypothetical protein
MNSSTNGWSAVTNEITFIGPATHFALGLLVMAPRFLSVPLWPE